MQLQGQLDGLQGLARVEKVLRREQLQAASAVHAAERVCQSHHAAGILKSQCYVTRRTSVASNVKILQVFARLKVLPPFNNSIARFLSDAANFELSYSNISRL